ncbi:MAG: MFS transporter [Pirellulales bacterium]
MLRQDAGRLFSTWIVARMAIASSSSAVAPRRSPARALRHRNFRLFLSGQAVSLIGTWMQQLGLSWLTYQLTGSAWRLALVNLATQVPSLVLASLAGVLADRVNRYRMVVTTQTVAMLQAGVLTLLVAFGDVEYWQLIALSFVLGVVTAFDMPTRQAFLVEMVPVRDDLANAVALNSSMVNGARLVGPFLAGLLIAAGGPVYCFGFNALSYVAVIGALLMMRDLPKREIKAGGPVLRGLVEGFEYAYRFVPIRSLLLLAALVSMMGASLSLLMPVFAEKVLAGGPSLLGFLTGASGLGALAAAVTLLSRHSVLGLGRLLVFSGLTFGTGLIAFGFSRSVPLSLLILVPTGFAMMFHLAASNTLLQTIVDEDKRGRVMSLYAMAFLGTAPLGSLLAGSVAERFGAPTALLIAGVGCVAGTLVFLRRLPRLRDEVRPIYRALGILPAATGPDIEPEAIVAVAQTAELSRPPERAL